MFAGATSLACPANRTTTTTTPQVPEKCIGNEELEKPDDWEGNDKWYDQCSSWRDPHFTRTFYADKADGSFDALREGLFNWSNSRTSQCIFRASCVILEVVPPLGQGLQ
jgi:hypothetical protein